MRDDPAVALNRRSWDAAVSRHNLHKGGAEVFFRNGGVVLTPNEKMLLGGVQGQRLLHPMCNDGREAFSLANLGASVVGIDFSHEAVAWARRLGKQLSAPVEIIEAEVLAWFEREGRQWRNHFDGVYVSRGTIWWLSDIDAFFRGCFEVTRSGGWLVILEFHPLLLHFDDDLRMRPWGVSGSKQHWPDGVEDYIGDNKKTLLPWVDTDYREQRPWSNPAGAYTYEWNLTDVVTAVAHASFEIGHMTEYPYVIGERVLSSMKCDAEGLCRLDPSVGDIPLMYCLRARKL